MPDATGEIFEKIAPDKQGHNSNSLGPVAQPTQQLPPRQCIDQDAGPRQKQAEEQPAPTDGIQMDPAQLLTLLGERNADETQAGKRDQVLGLGQPGHHQLQDSDVSNSAAAAARRNSSTAQPLASLRL